VNAPYASYGGKRVLLAKDFVHQQPQVVNLVIVNAEEGSSILGQNLACWKELWVHDRAPRRVRLLAHCKIAREKVARYVVQAGRRQVHVQRIRKKIEPALAESRWKEFAQGGSPVFEAGG